MGDVSFKNVPVREDNMILVNAVGRKDSMSQDMNTRFTPG